MSKARNLANLLADGAVGADELASTLDLSSKTLTLPAGTALPSQSGQNGNFLTTDGTSASWAAVGGGGSSITAGNSSVAVTDTGSNGTIAFNTDGSERMRINSSGQLMLGTATSTNTLSVDIQNKSASSNNVVVRIKNTTNNEDCGLTIEGESSATTRSYQIGINTALNVSDLTFSGPTGYRFLVGATTVVTMASTGDFSIAGSTATKASGTTWANPSDRRIKKNVRDYGKGLVELQQVRVREWEYNGKGGTTEGIKGLGVVADEIISVLPNTVDTYEDKLNADDEETTDIKRFDATEITWLLVKAVQELSAKNDALEARIAALEAQ